jgi:hypothetical protein
VTGDSKPTTVVTPAHPMSPFQIEATKPGTLVTQEASNRSSLMG